MVDRFEKEEIIDAEMAVTEEEPSEGVGGGTAVYGPEMDKVEEGKVVVVMWRIYGMVSLILVKTFVTSPDV